MIPNLPEPEFIPLEFKRMADDHIVRRSSEFTELMTARRSVRHFSPDPVPREAVIDCIRTAASAPSGANKQPWRFVLVDDPDLKRQIRIAAEKEERINYEGGRLPETWRRDLAHLGTDWHKPCLETAPFLIVIFSIYRKPNYYVSESVGIAAGMLVAALHNAGLTTLTHTPNPMHFLRDILNRPQEERPYLLLPVGYPARDARVPSIAKKSLDEVMIVNR